MKISRSKLISLLSLKLPEETALPCKLSIWVVEKSGDAAVSEVSVGQGLELLPADHVILSLGSETTRSWINTVLAHGPGQVIFHISSDGKVKVQPIPTALGAEQ